jgi:hypothetical protein|tara:strand:+ start:655 stop:792 length:138 start_codon:yes stop_codon:yes gene_type:complete
MFLFSSALCNPLSGRADIGRFGASTGTAPQYHRHNKALLTKGAGD